MRALSMLRAAGPRTPLSDLLRCEAAIQTQRSRSEVLGDALFLRVNPTYRSIREASERAGFRLQLRMDPRYLGWSLVCLDLLLEERKLFFRDNRSGLQHLENNRPGFFRIEDLTSNRPSPNYLLHESAHALAFHRLFENGKTPAAGARKNAAQLLRNKDNLTRLLGAEAFAMCAEFFAMCCLNSYVERWYFSFNSYRRRSAGQTAVAKLLKTAGPATTTLVVWLALFNENLLQPSMNQRRMRRCLEAMDHPLSGEMLATATTAARQLAQMNPEFLENTTRLFLQSLGYERNIITRIVALDPASALRQDPLLRRQVLQLLKTLGI